MHHDLERQLSKKHPSFSIFAPLDIWATRPRVLTYVLKAPFLKAHQIRGSWPPSGDLLALEISLLGTPLHLVNVYNAPSGCEGHGRAAHLLIERGSFCSTMPTILGGDFNMKHPLWQPGASSSGSLPSDFVAWLERSNLSLALPPGSQTRGNNTLDLVFGNERATALGARAEVTKDLAIGSDHEPIAVTLPLRRNPGQEPLPAAPLRLKTCDTERFLQVLREAVPDIGTAAFQAESSRSSASLDRLADTLVVSLNTALDASCKRAHKSGTGQPWWNDTCKRAHSALRRSIRSARPIEEVEEARRVFHERISDAKRQFWQSKMDNLTENRDIFSAIHWAHSTGAYPSPTLVDPDTGRDAVTPDEKRELLASTLLGKGDPDVQDIPVPNLEPETDNQAIYFPSVTWRETERAVLGAKNSAPGIDNLSTYVLKLAWPLIGLFVHKLYSLSLRCGWHPTAFRHATLIAIPKPSKRDRRSPRSYRIISLLSVLGKGLERVIARRLAWSAIHNEVLHKNQFGALPCRSSTDLTTSVTHDIETAFAHKKVASFLTLDVRGAFDAVLPGYLIRRLTLQGWPSHLIQWVHSFIAGRTGKLRLDNQEGDFFDIPAGLPQGSPISPILFMLFLAPIFRLGTPRRRKNRFSYADDLGLLAVNDTLDDNVAELRDDANAVIELGKLEGLTFDVSKTELMHFSQKPGTHNPGITLRFSRQSHDIAAVHTRESLRWLGVFFDRKLSFRTHIETLAARGRRLVNGIKALSNTVRGAPPLSVRRAIQACVIPTLTFAAPTWWQGYTRPSRTNPHQTVNSGLKTLCQKLEVELNNGLRAILPVYRTTPSAALHRETAIPPVHLLLDQCIALYSLRLNRLDPRHPLATRNVRPNTTAWPTRFARLAKICPSTEHISPLINAPWSPIRSSDAEIGFVPSLPRAQSALAFVAWLRNQPEEDLIVYSDGSALSSDEPRPTTAGSGWSVQLPSGFEITNGFATEACAEVYDAEIRAAVRGLRAALALRIGLAHRQTITICLDNLQAARSLLHTPVTSSQAWLIEFKQLASMWSSRPAAPTGEHRVRIRWVPGHSGIAGNAMADQLAKRGAGVVQAGADPTASYSNSRRSVKRNLFARFASYWHDHAPARYQLLGIRLRPRPPELALPRFALGKLLAARSGHGDFATYHRDFKHDDAALFCSCGAEKSPEHFFLCSQVRNCAIWQRHSTIQDILGTERGARRFGEFVATTRFFTDICPLH